MRLALQTHAQDIRKGDPPHPYVAHLLSVAALVLEDRGSEEEAIAALLHDPAEDHGREAMLERIAADGQLGPGVAAFVRGCSDSLLPEGQEKEDWRERKERYLAHLRSEPNAGTLRVANADKLHNARAILSDYRRVGEELWDRFTTQNARDQLWYYDELAAIFCERRPASPLAAELQITVETWGAELARESA